MNRNLYEIDNDIQSVLDLMVDPETGEISDDALAMLEELDAERQSKIENIALYFKNLSADIAAFKVEEDNLRKRRQSAEGQAARLKEYLAYFMPGETFETAKVKISWRKSTSVKIDDDLEFSRIYAGTGFLTPQEPKINKIAVGNALKAGEKLYGTELVEKSNIQVK